MSRGAIVTALVTGTALVGAGLSLPRQQRPRALPTSVVSFITPVIDLGVAEEVLAAMQRIPGDEVTVVLHPAGGCGTSCVLIANALGEFPRSTAIVPYMAISGGTLIALSATRLEMGGRASLSAVDPQIMGQRVKHLAESKDKPSIAALAREYDVAMRKYVRARLSERLPEDRLGPAMDLLLGEQSPHEWPIQRPEIEALGLAVTPAARQWADLVDRCRGRAW